MKKTFQVLNNLEKEGHLGRYAVGGAMAAMFYVEPVLTYDLDIFVVLPVKGGLVTLAPLYEALQKRGYPLEKECVVIEGVPVQFLPAHNVLLGEALREALDKEYSGVPARVLRPEHLMAIALQTGRGKDRARFRMFQEGAKTDPTYFESILARHGLKSKRDEWSR
jgi:hypothetical protein